MSIVLTERINKGADVTKLTVTFKTPTGHLITEEIDTTPHANGFVPDYRLRAMALNWAIVNVEVKGTDQ